MYEACPELERLTIHHQYVTIMEDIQAEQIDLPFKVSQIICLEHEATCLYGEVIQLIPVRKRCWFRPLCMIQVNYSADPHFKKSSLVHLRSSSDLLWPISLFRPALDTEVIEFLTDFNDNDKTQSTNTSSRQYLHQFVKQVWAANQDKF